MTRNKVRESVRASIKDGLAWAGMSGFVEPYIVPFALALGASNPAIGFLRAAPPLAASVAQLFNERMVRALGGCRRAASLDVVLQAGALFIAAAAVLLPPAWAFLLLAAAMTAYNTSGNMAGPPWAALMGEYIPARKRGAFFGFRNQLVGITFFVASLAAAQVLKFYPGLLTFSALFAVAGVFRLLSAQYIASFYEPSSSKCLYTPPAKGHPPQDPALKPFLTTVLAVMFSSFLVAPYFSVHVLTTLKYGYVKYMIIMTSGQVITFLLMRRWGALADSFGSVRVLRMAFIAMPLIPLLWALAPSFAWLVAVEIFSGVAWAAYGIGTNNFIYSIAGPGQRTRYTALFGFTACLGQFAGALAGGFLYTHLPGRAFTTLLLLSAALRAAAILPFLRRVLEKDVAAAAKPGFLLSVIGFRSIDIFPAPSAAKK